MSANNVNIELLLKSNQNEMSLFKRQIGTYGFCAVKLPATVADGNVFRGNNFFKSCQEWKNTYSFTETKLGYTNNINNEYFTFNTGNMLQHDTKCIPKEFISKITFSSIATNYKEIDKIMKRITNIIWKHFIHKTETINLHKLSLFKSALDAENLVRKYCEIHSKNSIILIPNDIINIIALFYINNNECQRNDFGMVYCGEKKINDDDNIFCSLSLNPKTYKVRSRLKFYDTKLKNWIGNKDNDFHIWLGPLAHKLSNGILPKVKYEYSEYVTMYNVFGCNESSIFDSKFTNLNKLMLLKQKQLIDKYIDENESMEITVKRLNGAKLTNKIKLTMNILELKKLFHTDWTYGRPEQFRWVYQSKKKDFVICMFNNDVLGRIFTQYNVSYEELGVIHAFLNIRNG
eukprot:500577_1